MLVTAASLYFQNNSLSAVDPQLAVECISLALMELRNLLRREGLDRFFVRAIFDDFCAF
jgi:hypothetical protein